MIYEYSAHSQQYWPICRMYRASTCTWAVSIATQMAAILVHRAIKWRTAVNTLDPKPF